MPVLLALLLFMIPLHARVTVGLERLVAPPYINLLQGKRVGLITNQTGVTATLEHGVDFLKRNAKEYKIVAFFAPEHGLYGAQHAGESVEDATDNGIPIYSLHGKTRRPTEAMLQGIDVLVFDIQDIGSRSYTYVTTLFYVMEEAAKRGITVVVADRPNPMNGVMVDGPMLEEKWRSIVGYINVPYCHGMTVGELARFFNGEYKVGCKLHVVPMLGWKREMSFVDTELPWIPTSPNIPEATSSWFYPTTGLLGELSVVSIGIGYPLPFKVVGAPFIEAKRFARALNLAKLPGVSFIPFSFKPFSGACAQEPCQGVLIFITNNAVYKPVQTQYLLMATLKRLYPTKFREGLEASKERLGMFYKVCGSDAIYKVLVGKGDPWTELRALDREERKAFLETRKRYLLY